MSDATQTLSCGNRPSDHPRLDEWPDKHLILGTCPKCGATGLYEEKVFAKVLAARQIADSYRRKR